ncbi:hypothetical protein SUDANB105_01109 [Streptomyces sp. enrichment culture]
MHAMRYYGMSEHAVGFLLGLIGDEDAARVRQRTGITVGADGSPALPSAADAAWRNTDVPSSVLLWVLEEDSPLGNAVVWRHLPAGDGLRRAIARGVPFGPGRTEPVPVDSLVRREGELPAPAAYRQHGLVGALRAVTTMATGRAAASMVVTPADWRTVTEADREAPLPGYARWALSVRPDCPPALREQFGSHPKFTHRLRRAGVLAGPAQYATEHGPARTVLAVLSAGRTLFPKRVREAEDALRPLVWEHLGGREEAWAVLAQLVDTYYGTVPELVTTAGAIA